MKRLAVLAAVFLLPSPVFAYFDNGNRLLAACEGTTPFDTGLCMGDIIGHYDMLMALGYRCGDDVTKNKKQMRDIVVKYLRENPEQRSDEAASLSFIAFFRAFGCTLPDPPAPPRK